MQHQLRRVTVTLALLGMSLSLIGVVSSGTAHADEATDWPLHMVTGETPTSMAAFGNDSLSFANCSSSGQTNSFQYINEGVTVSSLPVADSNGDGVSCNDNGALFAPNGTFYTTNVVNTQNHQALTFVAMKNGRALWETDLSTNANDPVCSATSSWGLDQYNVRMTGASIGSDGNIYGLVQPAAAHCPMYLTKVNSSDGTIVYKTPINTDQSSLPGDRLWVYSDKLLVLAQDGSLRRFNYDGTEDTLANYQFPMSTIGTITSAYANADGRVFVVGTGSGSDAVIGYADLNGTNGTITSGLGVNPQDLFMPGAGGNFTATYYYGGSVTTYHISSTGITSTVASAPPSSSTYSMVANYWQDQNGNAIMVRQQFDNNWASTGVTVDEIDGATGTVTNLLLVGVDSTHPSPTVKTADISPDGYLYAVICHDNSACGNTSGSSLDGWLHKVQTTDFGSPIKDTGQFTTFTSTTRNLVAMGDSYSSGEGIPPFLSGTDQTNDFCHRSAGAYPELLEKNTSLNLNMTAFVACSGATTHDILNINSNNLEFPQALFAENEPDVITMSIGGNDVQFGPAMQTCTIKNAPTADQTAAGLTQQDQIDQADCAQALSTSASLMTNALSTTLTDLYNSVNGPEGVAPSAKLIVVGYPQLYPDYNSISSGTCTWGTAFIPPFNSEGTPSGRAVSSTEVSTIRSLTTQMNTLIQTAVDNTNNSNVAFVDPTAAFAGHELCTSDPWLNGIVLNLNLSYIAGSYHPNAAGQVAYESAVASKISSLIFP